jgi:hypothetical protein
MFKHLIFLLSALGTPLMAQNVVRVTGLVGFDDPSQYNFVAGATYDLTATMVLEEGDDGFEENITLLYLTDKMIDEATPPATLVPEAIYIMEQGIPLDVPVPGYGITPANFRVGGNIVVIWPSYADPAIDSLEINVNVIDTLTTGFSEIVYKQWIPQLNQGSFSLESAREAGVSAIRVYDINGKVIPANANNQISLRGMPSSYYMLSFLYQGRMHVYKWLYTANP